MFSGNSEVSCSREGGGFAYLLLVFILEKHGLEFVGNYAQMCLWSVLRLAGLLLPRRKGKQGFQGFLWSIKQAINEIHGAKLLSVEEPRLCSLT